MAESYFRTVSKTITFLVKKFTKEILEDTDIKVIVRNNPKIIGYLQWVIVSWRKRFSDSNLFAKTYKNMEPIERLEILRLAVLAMNMSIYSKADEYDMRVMINLDKKQARNIGELYPGLGNITSGQLTFYVVNDNKGSNKYATDFLFNSNTLAMLKYRLTDYPDQKEDVKQVIKQVAEQVELNLRGEDIYNSYQYYFTGSNILDYLKLRPARDVDIGKLQDAASFNIDIGGITIEFVDITGPHEGSKLLTGIDFEQTLYHPKLWFLHRGLKYHALQNYVRKKFLRSNIKSFADLIAMKYFAHIPIPKVALPEEFKIYSGMEGKPTSITRDKFAATVKRTLEKNYTELENKLLLEFIQKSINNE